MAKLMLLSILLQCLKSFSVIDGYPYFRGSQYFGGNFGRSPKHYVPNPAPKRPNFSFRSFLPNYDQDKYYNMWKTWANENELSQWQRSAIPWAKSAGPSIAAFGFHPPITQLSMGTPLSELKFMFSDYDSLDRATQQAQSRQVVSQPPQYSQPSQYQQQPQQATQPLQLQPQPTPQPAYQQSALQTQPQPQPQPQPQTHQSSYDPLTYPVRPDFVSNPSRPCEQCNGDCNNFVCYGCGGCPIPPPDKQMYAYEYQKQDANYHDAFAGHVMDLSGMVMYPVPPMPKPTSVHKGGKNRKGKSDTPADDDDDDDDDEDDDNDDEDVGNFDSDDDVDDESDDNDNDSENDDNSTKKKKTKQIIVS